MTTIVKKYDYAVYIGRFQPFHQGHLACVREGLAIADKLIILVGSVNQPRSQKNPWNYKERHRMIRAALNQKQQPIYITGVRDYNHDLHWAKAIKKAVNKIANIGNESIALIGHNRDASSYYLTRFPDWQLESLPEYQNISATIIRNRLIKQGDIQSVTRPVADYIRHLGTNTFKALVNNTPTDKTYPDNMDGILDVA